MPAYRSSPESAAPCDTVVLAGGAARRMGGADKPGMELGGRTLLERVAAAAPRTGRLIVVGPQRLSPAAVYVREDPPGAGPIPAVRAGLAEVRAPWFALLAGDLAFLEPVHVTALRSAAAAAHSGAVLRDGEGRAQWLSGVWSTGVLRGAVANYAGASLRGLLGPLDPGLLDADAVGASAAFDCDTPAELHRARALLAQSSKSASATVSRRNPRAPRNSER